MEQLWVWERERTWKNSEKHGRKSLDCCEQTISRNMVVKDTVNDGSDASEEDSRKAHVILENVQIITNRLLVKKKKKVDVKGAASKGSEEMRNV